MGNLVTKLTTNNVELNESDASDDNIKVEKEKTPISQTQTKTGLFKNIWSYDPRSPSSLINRTPISIFRSNSAGKFNHKELNESIESQVDMDILTPQERDSLEANTDLVTIESKNEETNLDEDFSKLPDPRSPITEITRTPIVASSSEETKKKKDDNLVKKLADKLISTALSNDEKNDEKIVTKKSKNTKNLIFEDDETNMNIFSTPPKKVLLKESEPSSRTPLSCVANTHTPKANSKAFISTSTPKSKLNNNENSKSISRIPVSSARRIH
ncbi:CLUMA_CG013488, isoform A [Clunio marinus]|uniref:CLUMA_CG013488, isoform A n=1 Tax=Clunio marinus TaxID=568069 RepID=A0A1J1IMA8_9DIPT|nr:CLUMA_CG013488, isoform A [Clunio marinus]